MLWPGCWRGNPGGGVRPGWKRAEGSLPANFPWKPRNAKCPGNWFWKFGGIMGCGGTWPGSCILRKCSFWASIRLLFRCCWSLVSSSPCCSWSKIVSNHRSWSRNNHQTWTCCIRLQADVSCCLQTEQVRMVGSELLVFVSASSLSWSLITSSSSTSIWPDPDTLGDPTLLCNIVYH